VSCRYGLLAVLAAAFLAHAESAPLTGKVVDAQKLPVNGARVVVSNSSGTLVCRTVTAGAGDWHCERGVTLPVQVTVSCEQWLETTVTAGSADQPIVIELQPAMLLQTVVVSGSRVEELQDESAQRVEAVTRKQILDTGYRRVSDVLAEMPGVVTRRGSTNSVAGRIARSRSSRSEERCHQSSSAEHFGIAAN
jgi:hypothetical protein